MRKWTDGEREREREREPLMKRDPDKWVKGKPKMQKKGKVHSKLLCNNTNLSNHKTHCKHPN